MSFGINILVPYYNSTVRELNALLFAGYCYFIASNYFIFFYIYIASETQAYDFK